MNRSRNFQYEEENGHHQHHQFTFNDKKSDIVMMRRQSRDRSETKMLRDQKAVLRLAIIITKR